MDPILRLARVDDAQGVVAAIREVYDEYGCTWDAEGYHADLYDLRPYCDPEQARFWVAELNGEIVGCGGARFFPTIPGETGQIVIVNNHERIAGTNCEVARMYVRPDARNRGIASGIMRNIVQVAKWPIEIWSDKRFHDSHRLYQRFGAVIVGERICNDPDHAPEWGMILRKA